MGLPSVMGERAVGFRHLVRVVPLLGGAAVAVHGIENLGGQTLPHGAFGTAAGIRSIGTW